MTGHGTLEELGLIMSGRTDAPAPIFPAGEVLKEPGENEVQFMLRTFTFEENMRIAFVPMLISEMAWLYAFRAKRYAADKRLDEFKKLSRKVDSLHVLYIKNMKVCLDDRHIGEIKEVTNAFMKEFSTDFDILWYSVNNAVKKSRPDIGHQEMRTDACICVSLVRFLKAYGEATDRIVRKRLHRDAPIGLDPAMAGLAEVMKGYAGNIRADDGGHLKRCMLILSNNLDRVDFYIKNNDNLKPTEKNGIQEPATGGGNRPRTADVEQG